ncbi:MAG: Pyrimidine-nucleoside phosphorylase [Alphaproteobacteria bacterium ADurb.Bin438]|nr:MAG: Pyrimidine-nucleoside phosphorylase [Alphaproteobacteria bacterium ADurb.Bin438]
MAKIKYIPVTTPNQPTVFIHKKARLMHTGDSSRLTRVEIHGGINPVTAEVICVEDERFVSPEEIGISEPTLSLLGLKDGGDVSIAPASAPSSIESVRRKINGGILSASEYRSIINDISSFKYSPPEVAALIVANSSFMSPQEVLAMTESLVESNFSIKWDRDMVVDVHCIGGVPANRTNLIIAPIIAAYGLCIPKTAPRSVTSCSSDIDAMEVLAKVDFDEEELQRITESVGGAIVWNGGKMKMAPADLILMDIEKKLGISTHQQIVASILAQKIAAGVTHLVVDIPVGATAKIRSMSEAMKLRKLFEYVGDMLALDIDVVVTDGAEPIGNGVGPILEARDVMKVLRCKPDAPQDLREKALFLAGRILEFDPKLQGGQGYAKATEILDSGKALEALSNMINAQGKETPPALGNMTKDITAKATGFVESIDTSQIGKIALVAGSPKDKGAGIDLFKKVGDKVQAGDVLYRIYSTSSQEFAFANGLAEGYSGYEISNKTLPSSYK